MATVVYRGEHETYGPWWTVEYPELNFSVDIYAPTEPEALVLADIQANNVTSQSGVEETERTNENTLRQQLIAGLAEVDQHLAILAGAPTVAEQRAALIFALRAVKKLARLQVRVLDSVN